MDKTGTPAEKPTRTGNAKREQEALDRKLDEALDATYPASDPVALSAPRKAAREAG